LGAKAPEGSIKDFEEKQLSLYDVEACQFGGVRAVGRAGAARGCGALQVLRDSGIGEAVFFSRRTCAAHVSRPACGA